MDANDIDYYRRREAEQRERAANTRDPALAQLHLELAERYAAVVESQEALGRLARRPSVEPQAGSSAPRDAEG